MPKNLLEADSNQDIVVRLRRYMCFWALILLLRRVLIGCIVTVQYADVDASSQLDCMNI